jgi:hypothetical protein
MLKTDNLSDQWYVYYHLIKYSLWSWLLKCKCSGFFDLPFSDVLYTLQASLQWHSIAFRVFLQCEF